MKRAVSVPGSTKHRVIGGCKLSKHEPAGLRLKDFLHAAVAYPSSPTTCDWAAKAAKEIADIEGNDQYGDCVFAEDAHYIGLLTANANTLFDYSEAQTLADYSALTGFSPSNPASDQGADPIADLNWRVAKGYADGSKDAGWALVDGSNWAEVQYAVSTFGNLKMWFGIPDSIANSLPSSSGFVWDATAGNADDANGHAIGGSGYSTNLVAASHDGIDVMTWGMRGRVTKAALAKWFVTSQGGGLAVRVSTDWISKNSGQTPSGLNVSALYTAFNLYFGGKLVVPTPPAPSPTPAPAGKATLAQAEALAAQGLRGHALWTTAQALSAVNAGMKAGWPTS